MPVYHTVQCSRLALDTALVWAFISLKIFKEHLLSDIIIIIIVFNQ